LGVEEMKSINKIDKYNEIIIPLITEDVFNFKFTAIVGTDIFIFHFHYFLNKWNCWVGIDDLETRFIGVYPMVINNVAYQDFSIVFVYDGDNIGFDDLINCKIWVIRWHK
jgi:hypothetical protein